MAFISSISYRDKKWYDKRKNIIERDNHTCTRCGRRLSDDQLQVHHLHYFEERKPWEYEDFELITLCKHCHAEEHGQVKPSYGWKYEGMEDLEDLVGECDNCHQAIRYAHLISHPDWGFMTVGSQCAENLTSAFGLSEREEDAKRLAQRYRRYLNSPKWKNRKNGYFMDFDDYHIKIWSHGSYCNLEIVFPLWNRKTLERRFEKQSGKRRYATLNDAKTQAFKVITDGSLIKYCEKNFPYDTPYKPIYDDYENYD
jgi:hypothetical protein